MKNLIVTKRESRSLNFLKEQIESSNISKILHAVNSSNNDFYILQKNKIYKIPQICQEDIINVFNIDAELEFVSLEYCSISHALYGACKSGTVMKFDIELGYMCGPIIELNEDLQCMKLSPDHEMIIFVTTNGTVVTVVSTFQIISTVDLHAEGFGQKQFVTVGWGRKETQFHGSEGKKAATATLTELNRNDLDNGLYNITWREDGTLFAVGFLHRQNKVRQFKVFNREGILQYTSELINGLEETLAWKPSGTLIAATQVLQNKYVVVLFEKNGLKHREFCFPFKQSKVKVKDLFWSPDSEILTTWCHVPQESYSIIQLWSENNYHWYLKQTIEFSKDNALICASWSTVSSLKKLMFLTSKELIICEYNWSISHSRGKTIQDKSIVAVIDGNRCLITGFRVAIVPPPMAHQMIEMPESINAIVFAPDSENESSLANSNGFFCVSNNNKIMFYGHSPISSLKYDHIGTYDIKWNVALRYETCAYNMHHFLWLSESHVLCSLSIHDQSFLCVLTLVAIDNQTEGNVTVQQMHILDGLIQYIIPSPEKGEAYVVVENLIMKYTREAELIPIDIRLQNYSYKLEVVAIGTKHVIISLHHTNCFAINGKQIANNITSFFVHSEFLLLTTTQHTLICVHLNKNDFDHLDKHDLTVTPWENNTNDKSVTSLNIRRVERGSQIVVAIAKESKIILQMPRGNLECIQPRPLSLSIIGFYLDNCRYLDAFYLMRRQRINLNLIYDHDPDRFIKNAHQFVADVSKAHWLSLFFSELTDEDVTRTIYKNYYRRCQIEINNVQADKSESVCNLLRNIMEEKNNGNRFIQPILITLVKNVKKRGIEAALMKIKDLKELEEKYYTGGEGCVTSDEALKYLLYIVDVNVLFDIALGMYDFDLTMFIASKSHKDPKEYIPFLDNLRNLEEKYMKYSIDVHLKRYDSALEHIANDSSRFNECINFIRKHELYTKALKLLERKSEEYKEVARIYGEFLLKKRLYQEAGMMFNRSGSYNDALNAFKLAISWQDVITLSTQMELSETEKHELYKDLVKHLNAEKRYEEVAYILINYLKSPEETVVALCNCKHWKDAVRIAYDTKNTGLIESRIKTSLYEYANHVIFQLDKNKKDFEQHKTRLAIVRQNITQKNRYPHSSIIFDNESICDKDISDILSDTSSIVGSTLSEKSRMSTSSGKSYRSSKNRRKQERKLLSLKEGSVFEDLALIRVLYQIVSDTYKEQNDLHLLIEMLVYFEDDEYAEKIQSCMQQFLSIIEKSKFDIWDKFAPSSLTEMNTEYFSSADLQGLSTCQKLVEPYLMRPPIANSSPWKESLTTFLLSNYL